MTKISRHTIALAALVFLGACSNSTGDANRPNVLLISLDSTRQDSLSCYGRTSPYAPGRPMTPNLDRLAAQGVRFLAAYSSTSWTLPSHTSMLTGLPDLVHAVEVNDYAMSSDHPSLAKSLADAGYRTAGFYSGLYLSPRFGLNQGFSHYEGCLEAAPGLERTDELTAQLAAARDERDKARIRREIAELAGRAHQDVSSERVTEAVLAELEEARADSRPWFVFAHYFDPHYDYVPPPPHDTHFDPDYSGGLDGRDFLTRPEVQVSSPTPTDPKGQRRVVSDRDLEHLRALYDGEMEWTDLQIGRILEDLRQSGELDQTLVIVVADHGDEFFEHGHVGHRLNLYEEVLQVPLIVRYPSVFDGGRTVDAIVSITDLPATVLDVLGLEGAAEFSHSLVPLASGHSAGDDRFAISRLINQDPVQQAGMRGIYLSVKEAFIHGDIKVRREMWWIEPAMGSSPREIKSIQAFAESRRKVELLQWIDLKAAPDEPLAKYSDDFSDPRAAEALRQWQQVYGKLLAHRTRPASSDLGDDPAAQEQLRQLGYLDQPTTSFDLFERTTLPIPGAH